jgi:4-hydroxy-tetrahydrodipicolinate synthase
MSVGAKGVISVASNLWPREVGKLVALALAGDYRKARALHRRLYPVFKGIFIESNPAPIKSAMAAAGLIGTDEVRPPLCGLSAASRETLRRLVAELETK